MKKLILLLFIPYVIIAQDFKIEHKVKDDKTVDFSYKNLSPNTITVIVNFSFLDALHQLVNMIIFVCAQKL